MNPKTNLQAKAEHARARLAHLKGESTAQRAGRHYKIAKALAERETQSAAAIAHAHPAPDAKRQHALATRARRQSKPIA